MSSHHTSQRFCLRWNNHQSNLLSVFDQLLHDESFVDVTLAVEGQFLKAHKMVLSACSPYFQALFTGHPDKHPIVILKDVPFADMRSLLDFMYRGEVSVDQDRLTAFLKVAETLRIKGLTEVNEERCDLPSIASSLLSSAGFTQGTQPSSQQQQQQQQQRQEQQQSQPPSLHRIHVPTKRSLQNSMASNPLLGSALTAPKRKRGRPRRLSGSDEHRNQSHKSSTDSEDQRHDDDSDAPSSGVHGPPDLLEVNMPDYHHSPPSRLSQSDTSPPPSEDSTPIGNDSDQPSSKVKPEFEEPTPGTSQQESGGGSQSPKSSSQDSESKLPSEPVKEDMTFTLCDNASESTESSLTPYEHPDLSLIIEDIEMSVASIKSEPETRSDGMDPDFTSGVHFLTDESESLKREVKDEVPDLQQQKRELLEYLIQEDNTVICKWCGEVLPSRTHWYRHKYKFHVSSPGNLYKCHKCNAFFKSKKGYMGHVNTRHWKPEDNGKAKSDVLKLKIVDCNLEGGLTEYKIVNNMELSPKALKRVKSNFENIVNPSVIDEDYEKQKVKYEKEYEKQRQKEEQLVADIIDRVRKECEAQGSTVSRRGYSRRSTVMNSS